MNNNMKELVNKIEEVNNDTSKIFIVKKYDFINTDKTICDNIIIKKDEYIKVNNHMYKFNDDNVIIITGNIIRIMKAIGLMMEPIFNICITDNVYTKMTTDTFEILEKIESILYYKKIPFYELHELTNVYDSGVCITMRSFHLEEYKYTRPYGIILHINNDKEKIFEYGQYYNLDEEIDKIMGWK